MAKTVKSAVNTKNINKVVKARSNLTITKVKQKETKYTFLVFKEVL